MAEIRTRFAPSPTGYLHIGGARTALFNYLFARHHGGKFILRIEDTDRERSTPEAIQAILEAMDWLGLDYDEGPFYQTERYPIYRQRIQELLAKGDAYPCTCTAAELDAKRKAALAEKRKPAYDGTCRPPTKGPVTELPRDKPYTIRFRTPQGQSTTVPDLIKGDVIFANEQFDDWILVRSDDTPTYNYCVVIDDIDMRITHVIRGDDHLVNTPRQIQLYDAFGIKREDQPQFAHVPLILGTDKARLSKRHGATSVTAYRDMGYLPEAVNNYLVRLGWSHGDEEIFSRAELIEKFSLESVGKAAGVFNPEKFLWLNTHYLKARPLSQLAKDIEPFLRAKGYAVPADKAWLEKMIATLIERAKTLAELVDKAEFYLVDQPTLDAKAAQKFLTAEAKEPLRVLTAKLSAQEDFSEAAIEQVFSATLQEQNLQMGKLAQPVRVALTGTSVSPGIHEVIAVLGKQRTLTRLTSALAQIV